MDKIVQSLSLLVQIPLALFFYLKNRSIVGSNFFLSGFSIGMKLIFRRSVSPKLLVNPVSIFRYFEFSFCYSSTIIRGMRILDVSSPYLFGFVLCQENEITYHYLNPDKVDLNNVIRKSKKLGIDSKFICEQKSANHLEFSDQFFDRVFCISVIEHVDDNKDGEVAREMWRTLKSGGEMLLTFPVMKKYDEEYRSDDVYSLNNSQKNKEYFFQRFYDEQAIKDRILSKLDDYIIIKKQIFGEINAGFFSNYEKKWKINGYWETLKDPEYINNEFKIYDSMEQLPGVGVVGLQLKKK